MLPEFIILLANQVPLAQKLPLALLSFILFRLSSAEIFLQGLNPPLQVDAYCLGVIGRKPVS